LKRLAEFFICFVFCSIFVSGLQKIQFVIAAIIKVGIVISHGESAYGHASTLSIID